MEALGLKATRPTRLLSLGDPSLLRMDLGEAAAHFGVAVPIGKRDRKSGARKRKQQEIELERQNPKAEVFDAPRSQKLLPGIGSGNPERSMKSASIV